MIRHLRIYLIIYVWAVSNQLSAKTLLDRVNQSLSASEERYQLVNADFTQTGEKTLYANPAFTQ